MVGAPLGPQSVNLGARVQSQPPEPVQTRFCVLPGCRPVGQKCRFGPGAGGLDQTPGGLDLALFLAICTDSSPEAPPQCDPAPLCHMFTRWEESHLVHTVPISAAIVPDRDSPPLIKTDPGHSWNQLPPYPPRLLLRGRRQGASFPAGRRELRRDPTLDSPHIFSAPSWSDQQLWKLTRANPR